MAWLGITLHAILLHYIALHYIASHHITLHYIKNDITLHGNILHRLDEGSDFASLKPLGSLTSHDMTWHGMIDITLHRITSPYSIALHCFALLYIILYY